MRLVFRLSFSGGNLGQHLGRRLRRRPRDCLGTLAALGIARLPKPLRVFEQAALSLGATPRAAFWQVTQPLIRPGVLVGALFAFITSFDELIVALFISGTGAVTLSRRMWDDLRFQIDPTIAAVSTLTIVLTAALMASAHLLRKRA